MCSQRYQYTSVLAPGIRVLQKDKNNRQFFFFLGNDIYCTIEAGIDVRKQADPLIQVKGVNLNVMMFQKSWKKNHPV